MPIRPGRLEAGAITGMVGRIAFIPIGLIGVFGARRAPDEHKRQAVQASTEGA